MAKILGIVVTVAALAVAMVVHESAHALAAYALGDKTARERGRVSLNPLNHIDPFGTVILPLLMYAAGGMVFAFAKPVPVAVNHLKNPKRDEVLVSLAGPASNLALAALGALVMHLIYQANPAMSVDAAYNVMSHGSSFVMVNLSLCFFNLIPLPPLDGSSIIVPFLKGNALRTYYQIQQYSMPILIIVLYLLPRFLGVDVIGAYYDFTVYPLGQTLLNYAVAPIIG